MGKLQPKLTACLVSFLFLTLSSVDSGKAQESEIAKFPSRPITIVVPYSAGGSADLFFRLLGKEAEKFFRQPVVVVNKAGGGGAVGFASVATAKPDGYTIGHSPANPIFILPFLENLPYHPVRDFKYIMQFVDINFGIIVKADSPFKNFKDIIAYARENPKKISYGTNSPNSKEHLILNQIAKKEKVQFIHIPYKSSPELQTAVLGGHISLAAGDFSYSLLDGGEVRLLLFLGEKRSSEYPDIPILRDLGYDIPCPSMLALAGPKGLPDEIVRKLEEGFTKALKEPSVMRGIKDLHLILVYRDSKEMNEYVARNYEAFGKLLKEMETTK